MNISRNNIKLFLLLALLCLTNPIDTFAADYRFSLYRLNSCVNEGSCKLICGYTNEIATHKDVSKDSWTVYSSYIYYSVTDNKFFVESHRSDKARTTHDWDSKSLFKSSYANDMLKKGECPQNGYIENGGFSTEVCFDDNSSGNGYCKTKDPGGWGTKFEGKSILEYSFIENELQPWLDNWAYDDVDCLSLVGKSTDQIEKKISEEFQKDWKNYALGEKIPQFMIDSISGKSNLLTNRELPELKKRCSAEWEQAKNDGKITEEEKNNAEENLNNADGDEIVEDFTDNVNNSEEEKTEEKEPFVPVCGIFGENSWKYVQTFYDIIRIAIPALIILLGMLDFIQVLFSGEEKDMKAAGQKFAKRIIAGVVFLLLPVLLDFIFGIVGFSENCLGKFM